MNDQPILLSRYQASVATFAQTLEAQGTPIDSNDGQAQLDTVREQVFEGLVDQQIIQQYARQVGIAVTEPEVKTAAQELRRQTATADQFEQWLTSNNLSERQFLDDLRFQLIANRVIDRVTQDVPQSAQQVRLQLVWVPESADADAIVSQITRGQSFDNLVASGQYQSRVLDWFPRQTGVVPKAAEEVAFSLQPGDISGPIQTENGYYIIKLEGKEANRPLSIDTRQQLKKQVFELWLQKQRALARVERFVALP